MSRYLKPRRKKRDRRIHGRRERRGFFVPHVEPLEDRLLLTTINFVDALGTVSNFSNQDITSLDPAISFLNSAVVKCPA